MAGQLIRSDIFFPHARHANFFSTTTYFVFKVWHQERGVALSKFSCGAKKIYVEEVISANKSARNALPSSHSLTYSL